MQCLLCSIFLSLGISNWIEMDFWCLIIIFSSLSGEFILHLRKLQSFSIFGILLFLWFSIFFSSSINSRVFQWRSIPIMLEIPVYSWFQFFSLWMIARKYQKLHSHSLSLQVFSAIQSLQAAMISILFSSSWKMKPKNLLLSTN